MAAHSLPKSLTDLPLLRHAGQTLTDQLAERFAARIRDQLLPPGARLPSVRQCAAQQGLSPSTVVAAYEQLLAQGLVKAEQGRGFFVRAQAGKRTRADPPSPVRMSAPIHATALIRGMFAPAGAQPQPGLGTLPADWLQTPFLGAALRRVSTPQCLGELAFVYG